MHKLLTPRYQVISPYPDMTRKVGDIAVVDITKAQEWIDSHCAFFERYPLLFKKLDWWDEIPVEQYPTYVKVMVKSIGGERDRHGKIYQVESFRTDLTIPCAAIDGGYYYGFDEIIPATEEEFKINP